MTSLGSVVRPLQLSVPGTNHYLWRKSQPFLVYCPGLCVTVYLFSRLVAHVTLLFLQALTVTTAPHPSSLCHQRTFQLGTTATVAKSGQCHFVSPICSMQLPINLQVCFSLSHKGSIPSLRSEQLEPDIKLLNNWTSLCRAQKSSTQGSIKGLAAAFCFFYP